jgi:hypothetical protein
MEASVEELRDVLHEPTGWRTKARLAAEILAAYVKLRRRMGREQLPEVLAEIRDVAGPGDDDPVRQLAVSLRLGRAVRRILGSLPADSTCLVESLVLVALLERRGVETSLVIGVEPGDDFRAHAWVEFMGEPLLPASQGVYERLTEL